MSCRKCKFLDVPDDKAGRFIARKNGAYRCSAPQPEMPILPMSILTSFEWPPHRRFMISDGGIGCPVFEARTKTPNAVEQEPVK